MNGKRQGGKIEGRPVTEWLFGLASAVLVLALLVFLAYQALFAESAPPSFEVSVEKVERRGEATWVTVAVANRGDKAASAVTVTATPLDALAGGSSQQIEFDYIAANGIRRGAFMFAEPATADQLDIAVTAYTEP